MIEQYEKYKDSGIAWLGDIPKHWQIKKLKHLIQSLESGVSVNSIDIFASKGNYGILKTSCVYRYIFEPQQNKKILLSELDRAKISPKKGAIIISRMNTPELVGASGYVDQDYNHLFLPDRLWQTVFFENLDICTKWLSFSLKSSSFRELLSILATGTSSSMKNLGQEEFLNIKISLPPLEEQKAIAAFLDRKTAEIDELIAQKQRLIALYEEEKTAIINEAVTKGINPDVKLKPTAIDWLGDIPEHWEVKKLKYLAEIIDCKNRTPDYFDGGEYLVVRTSNIKHLQLDLDNALYTNKENFIEWTKRGVPQVGSVLFTREAPAGEAALVPKDIPLCLGQRMMSLKSNEKVLNPLFLLYFIYSNPIKIYVSLCSSGSTVSHLRVPQIYEMPILSMQLEEQKAISEYIEKETTRIDTKIAKTKRIIELQKEYRTALISEAVTGKIKVPALVS